MDATAAYKKANDLLERLTIEEKALMVRGYNKFFIKGFEEKGILPIYLSDATQGVNIRNNLPDPNVVKQLERSTAFPDVPGDQYYSFYRGFMYNVRSTGKYKKYPATTSQYAPGTECMGRHR